MTIGNPRKTVGSAFNRRLPRAAGPVLVLIVVLTLAVQYRFALLTAWDWYEVKHDAVAPLGTFIGAALVAWAALRQAKTARLRHEEQTDADKQRRIIESFSKATEQLGSDKLEVRLGGIYTMERISRESSPDYWPVMETLTAFVRHRARWKMADKAAPENLPSESPGDKTMPTDIDAVLSVICRREQVNYQREVAMGWTLDLRRADLEGASLKDAHLENANLYRAHLERAFLREAYLTLAFLGEAHLEEAILVQVHLEMAHLKDAHLTRAALEFACLQGANLEGANLEGALLTNANLEGAKLQGALLMDAHLEGANLAYASGLEEGRLSAAHGDAMTILPKDVARPSHWPAAKSREDSGKWTAVE